MKFVIRLVNAIRTGGLQKEFQMTPKQRELAKQFGTPSQFDKGMRNAYRMRVIGKEESISAVEEYDKEWKEAGIRGEVKEADFGPNGLLRG